MGEAIDRGILAKIAANNDGRLVLFCDDKISGENARAIQTITKESVNVHFLPMVSSTDIKTWMGNMEKELKPVVKANKLRIITNRYRRDDGGEQAGELLMRWFAENKTWKKVPVLLYCGNIMPVQHLHQPKKRMFVSNSAFIMAKFVANGSC